MKKIFSLGVVFIKISEINSKDNLYPWINASGIFNVSDNQLYLDYSNIFILKGFDRDKTVRCRGFLIRSSNLLVRVMDCPEYRPTEIPSSLFLYGDRCKNEYDYLFHNQTSTQYNTRRAPDIKENLFRAKRLFERLQSLQRNKVQMDIY